MLHTPLLCRWHYSCCLKRYCRCTYLLLYWIILLQILRNCIKCYQPCPLQMTWYVCLDQFLFLSLFIILFLIKLFINLMISVQNNTSNTVFNCKFALKCHLPPSLQMTLLLVFCPCTYLFYFIESTYYIPAIGLQIPKMLHKRLPGPLLCRWHGEFV